MIQNDIEWYAINETELKGFCFVAILAGGSEFIQPIIDKIRNRAIDFHITENEEEGD